MIPREKGTDSHQDKYKCAMCGKVSKQEMEFVLGMNAFACAACFYRLQNLNE